MTQAEQSATSLANTQASSLTDEEVIQFLSEDPDFFQRNPDFLQSLYIPHEKGTAISLVEKQINLLREKNTALEKQLATLIEVAKGNNETLQQIHRLTVDVLAAENAQATLQQLTDELAKNFSVEHVVIRLFADSNHPLQGIDSAWVLTSQSARQTLDEFTPTSEPLCGRLQPGQLKRLFGENADVVKSSVLIPLRKSILHGVIALGSASEHRFNPTMDTLYMKQLGDLVAAALLRFIK